jgi:hypothetical protein
MHRHLPLLLALSLFTLAAACADDPRTGPLVEPPGDAAKADAADRVTLAGELLYGTAVTGAFTEDLSFFGYVLAARPGARVKLEVTHKGSSSKLDSTLFVYGPRSAAGFGTQAIAVDDDRGWGRLSRLDSVELTGGGEYLVVIGTHDARGRGKYRLEAVCLSGECEPELAPPAALACHSAIREAIAGCVEDTQADPESAQPSGLDALELCADAEVVASARDSVCADGAEQPGFCALAYEDFAAEQLPLCRDELAVVLGGGCVLGGTWGEALHRQGILVGERRVLTSVDGLDATARAQVVLAVQASSHSDVTTAEEALSRVDGQEMNVVGLFDATNGRAFVAYEYGAGDNSYGRIFELGTTVDVARIHDGDLVGCAVSPGPGARECESNSGCADGLACAGKSPNTGVGRCAAVNDEPARLRRELRRDPPLRLDGRPVVRRDVAGGGEGLCLPAWMLGQFESVAATDIPEGDGLTVGIEAYGLATVATDVWLSVVIRHPAVEQLQIRLEDPATTEVIVYDGEASGEDLWLDVPVRGIPGDESANGRWILRVVDSVGGGSGVLQSWRLTLGSRWD